MTLAEFLLARFAKDEAAAQGAISASSRGWRAQSFRVVTEDLFEVAEASVPSAAHIARHDPARVLAECEAKRRIVDLVTALGRNEYAMSGYADELLSLLALPYADHPDCRPEWVL